jgi:hypothetical protein
MAVYGGSVGGASRALAPSTAKGLPVPQPPPPGSKPRRPPVGRAGAEDRAPSGAASDVDRDTNFGGEFLDFPLLETISKINAQVRGLRSQLAKADSQVVAALGPPPSDPDAPVERAVHGEDSQSVSHASADAPPDGTFITGVDVAATERSRAEAERNWRGALAAAKSVEALPWPGVLAEPLDLPGKLVSLDVLKRLGDNVRFARKQDQRMWEEYLATKQAGALMQDFFWWFYCDKFAAGDRTAEQERMFGRMATNFVALASKVAPASKDRFFAAFHNVLAEGVLVAYKVALPESDARFGRAFRGELARTAAYWTTGADIGPIEYVRRSGQLVRADPPLDGVARVVGEIRAERDELAAMVADHKGKKPPAGRAAPGHGHARTPGGAGSAGGAGRSGGDVARGRRGEKVGEKGAARHGGKDAGSPEPRGKSGAPSPGRAGGGAGRAGSARPPGGEIPPLRLPARVDTELRTPRALWTSRKDVRAGAGSATARSGASTRRAVGGLDCAGPRGAHTARGALDRRSSAGSGAAARGSGGGGGGGAGWRSPGGDSTRSESGAAAGAAPAESAGIAHERALEQRGERFVDLRGCSPFMRYYLLGTKGSAHASAPRWRRMHADEEWTAWGRQELPDALRKRRAAQAPAEEGAGGEAEEDGDLGHVYVRASARELSEAVVKRSSRMVREYHKRGDVRARHIGEDRRQALRDYVRSKREMRGILAGQESAKAFSNLLVSSKAGGLVFDKEWKKWATKYVPAQPRTPAEGTGRPALAKTSSHE